MFYGRFNTIDDPCWISVSQMKCFGKTHRWPCILNMLFIWLGISIIAHNDICWYFRVVSLLNFMQVRGVHIVFAIHLLCVVVFSSRNIFSFMHLLALGGSIFVCLSRVHLVMSITSKTILEVHILCYQMVLVSFNGNGCHKWSRNFLSFLCNLNQYSILENQIKSFKPIYHK